MTGVRTTEKNNYPIYVAMIMGKLWAGGVESVIFNYYRAIDHNKIQFDFYYDSDSTVDPPKDIVAMGAKFIKIPPYQQLGKYLFTLRHYFSSKHYLIVHSNINSLSVFPLYAAKRAGIPVRIAHNHSVPGGKEIKRDAAKEFLKLFSHVNATDYFSCSEKAGRWLFGNRTFDKGKVFVVKNAVDFKRFCIPNKTINSLKKNLNIEDNFIVGHVGRFTYAKNHKKLIRIFKEIKCKKPAAKLLLVGDGELHNEIIDYARSLNVLKDTIFVGKVSNPEIYYSLMNVIVLPSIFEGLSMTTIEAQISGVPIVISEAIPDEAIISDGCFRMNNSDPDLEWAMKAIDVADVKVNLNFKAKDYDIKLAAPKLQNWYINKIDYLNAKLYKVNKS